MTLRLTEQEYEALRKRRAPAAQAPVPVHESKLEVRFDQQLRAAGMPPHERNYFFLPGRDLELDRAWPERKVAVEIQGGAHRIKKNFRRDIEKRALAMLAGWKVLEIGGHEVRNEIGICWLRQLMKGEPG